VVRHGLGWTTPYLALKALAAVGNLVAGRLETRRWKSRRWKTRDSSLEISSLEISSLEDSRLVAGRLVAGRRSFVAWLRAARREVGCRCLLAVAAVACCRAWLRVARREVGCRCLLAVAAVASVAGGGCRAVRLHGCWLQGCRLQAVVEGCRRCRRRRLSVTGCRSITGCSSMAVASVPGCSSIGVGWGTTRWLLSLGVGCRLPLAACRVLSLVSFRVGEDVRVLQFPPASVFCDTSSQRPLPVVGHRMPRLLRLLGLSRERSVIGCQDGPLRTSEWLVIGCQDYWALTYQ
jgi:hypothetical protein